MISTRSNLLFRVSCGLLLLVTPAVALKARSTTTTKSEAVRYPEDSGVVNVRTQYGARGDGSTDDTAAILKAIGDNRGIFQRILFFPAGTYIVSDTLYGKAQDGNWKARLTLQGENQSTTVIKLKDNLPTFQDPLAPKAVIQTGSINPFNKQTGAGNNGFRNYVLDLTIDTGKGNPGAVGIDYLANNVCGMENVTIRSGDPQGLGVVGLWMKRSYVGPCLYKRVEVTGFDFGILTAATEYSHTFEHLKLSGQRVAGIGNTGNVLSIRDLESVNSAPAILNSDPSGFVTLIDSKLDSPTMGSSAILNSGALVLRNVSVNGYAATVLSKNGPEMRGNVTEYLSPSSIPSNPAIAGMRPSGSSSMTLNLPVEETPELASPDLSRWVNVVAKGAVGDGKTDSTKAIQSALDSGAEVVYLPAGNYRITDTLHVKGGVQKLLGLGAVLLPDGAQFVNANAPTSFLRIESANSDLCIEGVQFGWWDRKNYPGTVWLEDVSPRALVLRHVDFQGAANTVYKAGAARLGPLFIEDVEGFRWKFDGPQHIWARQFDVEGNVDGSKILNNGAFLWILGLKTEGPQTVLETDKGGLTELLGGLLFPVKPVASEVPAFVVNKGTVALSYAVSAYKPENNYQIHFKLGGGATSVNNVDLPKRGNGTLATTPVIKTNDSQ
jgi:hypothetical protein